MKYEHLQAMRRRWHKEHEQEQQKRAQEAYQMNRAACPPKVKHRTIEEAEREAVRMRAEHSQPFDVYECAFCHFFHIGRPSFVKHPRTRKQ